MNRIVHPAICFLACLMASGVQALAEEKAVVPTGVVVPSTGVNVLNDQRFSRAEGNAGLCDIYTPQQEAPANGRPAVMVIHGGAWSVGDKWPLQTFSKTLARNGFVAITINYRLAPKHKFPAQVDDVREALLWTVANAERFSIDLDRVGLCGYSAGGHLSTLVGSLADEPIAVRAAASNWAVSDERWAQLPSIHAVCAGGPPCDFRSIPMDNQSLAYFLGGSRRQLPGVYVAASPTAHVSAADPVTQLIHGEADVVVPIAGTQELHKAQKAAGVDSRFEMMPKQGHMITFLNPKTSSKMLEFFKEVFAKP